MKYCIIYQSSIIMGRYIYEYEKLHKFGIFLFWCQSRFLTNCPIFHVYRTIIARQRFGKYIIVAINTRKTNYELLDMSFSVWSMSYQRKAGDTSFQNFFFMYCTPLQLWFT
jgi:hypothetical protein